MRHARGDGCVTHPRRIYEREPLVNENMYPSTRLQHSLRRQIAISVPAMRNTPEVGGRQP
jgi:hypothetical protein